MYGSRKEFEGRITGFTMGTGETLALLPPQNATGNYVKIVQRLPVRIELTDYDPDKLPLFVGLSVEPYVYYKEPPKGPNAGAFLQPPASSRKPPRIPSPEQSGACIMSAGPWSCPRPGGRRSTPGSSPPRWSSPPSWKCWTPRSPTWAALHRRRWIC